MGHIISQTSSATRSRSDRAYVKSSPQIANAPFVSVPIIAHSNIVTASIALLRSPSGVRNSELNQEEEQCCNTPEPSNTDTGLELCPS